MNENDCVASSRLSSLSPATPYVILPLPPANSQTSGKEAGGLCPGAPRVGSHLKSGPFQGTTAAETGLSCLHLPLSHVRCGRGRVEQAVLRQKEERSVAAQECELRDCGLPGLRRHEADIVFRHHIFPSTIRPHYR